ncbi:MAG: imidazole glycerol phosphate synthase subunit HisH [Clostridia bacterium]|nr:imidazole glycerol phosphate synthase subunit HisH [Clostridia bacterium]
MIAVVDYGVGNLYSLLCSFSHVGADAVVTREVETLRRADRVVLPGVGAFGDAARRLRELGLDRVLRALAKEGKPFMGICLGMQLLFERSLEYGQHEGLGLIPGTVSPLTQALTGGQKVPHMGWNSLVLQQPNDPLLRGVREGDFVYYVHSYYATECENAVVASSPYGVMIPGLVRAGNVCGAQFHPEKSGEVGLRILKAFAEEADAC